jgi:hypothetical protein
MIWGNQEIKEQDFEELLQGLLSSSEGVRICFAYWLHHRCHLWDEIDPNNIELVVEQNMGKWAMKRAGMVQESNIYELTRRMIEVSPPAQLREKIT